MPNVLHVVPTAQPALPLHVELARELFSACVDTASITRQLSFSLDTSQEPGDALVMAAFEAAHMRQLDMHVLFHDLQAIPFRRR